MLRKITTAVLSLMMATAAATLPVFAEGETAYPGVAGGTVNINKYLVMDTNANVPNVTFSFTIAPGTAIASDASSTKAQVKAGPAGATIGTAVFTMGQTTYDTAQTLDAGGTQHAGGATETDPVDGLDSGEKYAKSMAAVNLTGVTFPEPGIYRYVITETASTAEGITNDTNTTRILDVYVEHDDAETGKLAVKGYVLHAGTDTNVNPAGTSGVADKAKGFTNTYTSHDLTISKAVAGNAASRDEYFKFTVTIENAVAGTKYDVDLTNADAATKTNTINTESHTNPANVTVPAGATSVTQDFWLQGGQSIVIKGLANNTKYTIAEDDSLLDNEGYTTAVVQTGDNDGTFTADTRTLVNNAITADTTDAFTNTKSETIPTGLVDKVAPYIAVIVIAGGFFVLTRKKKGIQE